MWRIGHPKYFLFFQGISEIKKAFNLSRKKASFLAAQESALVDRNTWLEEFLCPEHGKVWMRVSKSVDGFLTVFPATDKDWKRTTRTINPNFPNPSVSEYSYRHSRRSSCKKYYEPS